MIQIYTTEYLALGCLDIFSGDSENPSLSFRSAASL